jgi:hypothetical protein
MGLGDVGDHAGVDVSCTQFDEEREHVRASRDAGADW